MKQDISITVAVCTHNKAAGLRRTLESLDKNRVSRMHRTEVIMVDNASTDETESVIRSYGPGHLDFRYLFQPQKGLSHARNTALAAARGEVILFTDDDVLVADDWIEQMATPLLNRRYDASTGIVTLAPGLLRPWMHSTHKGWLASSREAQVADGPYPWSAPTWDSIGLCWSECPPSTLHWGREPWGWGRTLFSACSWLKRAAPYTSTRRPSQFMNSRKLA
jgi:glycosyltransferase involved in cell wall biosynthesis